MAFWSENYAENPLIKDPKRKFRFKVEFTGIDAAQGGSLLWYAKTCDKPKFEISSTEHSYLNHTFYYPGKVSWQEVSIAMVDPVDPDVTATFSDMIVQSGYSPPTNANALGSISKAKAAGALGTVYITQLDADGAEIEKWTLWNAFLTKFESETLEYGTDELATTTIGVRYDWARVETLNNSSLVNSGGNEFFNV